MFCDDFLLLQSLRLATRATSLYTREAWVRRLFGARRSLRREQAPALRYDSIITQIGRETIYGNISLVGVGALDDPSLCDAYSSGQRKIITCMWSGITTYRSIFTPGMFSLDNQYFSVILPISVHCICGVNGSSKAPTPTGLIISESILFLSLIHIVIKYAPAEL